MLFLFRRVPAFPGSGVRAAPHTSVLAFSFLACTCLPLQRRLGRSAHVCSYFFFSGVCLPSLAAASGSLLTRQLLLFFFPACVCLPWQRRQGRSAHVSSCFFLFGVCLPSLELASEPLLTRQFLLFPFWRVPAFPGSGVRAAPHTSALAFSFLACACLPWQRRLGRSAHVSSCFFFFGVCLPSLAAAIGPLRTRQFLLFPFWRVPAFPGSGVRAAPHTSALAFSFLACACLPWQRRLGRSAHVSSCFFFFGVCLPSLAAAIGPLRTRQFLLFPFWRVPAFPGSGVRAAPHTSALAFSFLACACLRSPCHISKESTKSITFFLHDYHPLVTI